MPKIIIPGNFKKNLPEDSFVYGLIRNVEPILSKIPYFPEYTIHDEDHICAVLKLADKLIPSRILKKLKGKPLEILIGAIILHDLGMFIERDGLERLIFGKHKNRCEKYLDKLTWNKAWKDFYNKVQRYTNRQLEDIFGNNVPKDYCLLYGEFLRQNHARLAFDITQIGFPGNGIDIDVFEKCDCHKSIKTSIGIVARSHCMKKLRDAEEFLDNYPYTPPENDVPLYYLMAVLRMADILHIGRERAPKSAELKNKIDSPESQRQFRLNQAIIKGPSFDIKKKSVYIVAEPEDSSTFEDVENQLHNIIQELDFCWSVLAEKYTYEYELSIHRIKSNLFDENKVAAFNNKFLTRRVTLSANPDIVKLLVKPLYSNNPSYGVRELVQNAVDACNERTLLDDTVGKIAVTVDTKKKTFEIIDNGIGMNEDVLINYFLVAGSSFRESNTWRERHIDDNGKAKFARSGRFGIGALAAFLIGDKITVTTRHKDDELGYNFNYTMEPKTLDIKRIKAEIGTKIVIKIHEEALNYFQENSDIDQDPYAGLPRWYYWYHFSTPQISYYLDGKQIGENQFIILDKGKDGWCDIPSKIFPSIKIKFRKRSILKSDFEILVNGIIINKMYYGASLFGSIFKFRLYEDEHEDILETMPLVSIVDPNNVIDINLTRTDIYNFPENSIINEEVVKYYLARLLSYPVNNNEELNNLSKFFGRRAIFKNNTDMKKCGFTLYAPSFICNTKPKKAFLFYGNYKNIFNNNQLMNIPITILDDDIPFSLYFDNVPKMQSSKENKFTRVIANIGDCQNFWYDFSISNQKIKLDKKLKNDKKYKGAQPPFGLMFSNELELIVEYAPTIPTDPDENLMLKVLREYLPVDDENEGFIPFDMNKRKELYPKAFSDLKRYMDNGN